MKTNKFFLALAAFAAVSMSSCSQEEELVAPDNQLSDNAVVFGTYIGASRATDMDLTALQEKGFGVMAYYTGQDVFGAEGTKQTPNFMYNQLVSYKNNAWTYEPLKYWPNNSGDMISFFAYAPYTDTFGTSNINAISANTAAGAPTLTFVMDADVNKQIDLLYADAATSETNKIVDLIKPGVNDKVNFKFKHALSQVSFSRQLVVDGSDAILLDGETTVTINSVTFSAANFGKKGTLNLASGEWSVSEADYGTMAYEISTSKKNIINNVITGGTNDDVKKAMDKQPLCSTNGNIMFIPVAKTTEDNKVTTITIDYTVTTKDTKLDGDKSEITNNITVNVPTTFSFKAGFAYNFVLKIGLTSVKLAAVEVADWGTGEISDWNSIVF